MGVAKAASNLLLSTILLCILLVWNLKQFLPDQNQKPLPALIAQSVVLPDQAERYLHRHHYHDLNTMIAFYKRVQ